MSIKTNEIPVGVVGLGLMGCSITTCLLMAGHPVIAIAPISVDMTTAESRIRRHFVKAKEEGMVTEDPEFFFKNLNTWKVCLNGFLLNLSREFFGNRKLSTLVFNW